MTESDHVEISELLDRPDAHLSDLQKQWLDRRLWYHPLMYASVFTLIWAGMKIAFRVRCSGLKNIPASGPWLLTPNHSSSLDPMAIGAALGYRRVRNLWWAGWDEPILKTGFRRFINRTAKVMPISRGRESLAAAAAILRRNQPLVWFPEGTRSTDGELQEFKPGVGVLLKQLSIDAIPCHIAGAYSAMPAPGHTIKSLTPITVRFGEPFSATEFPNASEEELAAMLRERVAALNDHV